MFDVFLVNDDTHTHTLPSLGFNPLDKAWLSCVVFTRVESFPSCKAYNFWDPKVPPFSYDPFFVVINKVSEQDNNTIYQNKHE